MSLQVAGRGDIIHLSNSASSSSLAGIGADNQTMYKVQLGLRPVATVAATAVFTLGGVLAALPSMAHAAPARPRSATPSASPATPAPTSTTRYGVSYGGTLTSMTPSQLKATLNNDVQLGVKWIREQIDWSYVQYDGPGTYDWAAFDQVVQAVNAHHLQIMPVIDFTPPWARAVGCVVEQCAPAIPSSYAAFAAAAVARYAPLGVHTWEIWNEPNITEFWQPRPDPQAFSSLLEAAVPAMQQVDPTARVISGGLSPAGSVGGNIDPRSYLTEMCSEGGVAAVDGIGFHPYSYPVPPSYDADWNAWDQMSGTQVNLLGILAACGQSSKKIWATEYGAPTNGPGVEATTSNYELGVADHVSDALQATMVSQAIQLTSNSPWIAALFLYTNQDTGTSTITNEDFFGLRNDNGSPKPAWAAAAKELQAVGASAGG